MVHPELNQCLSCVANIQEAANSAHPEANSVQSASIVARHVKGYHDHKCSSMIHLCRACDDPDNYGAAFKNCRKKLFSMRSKARKQTITATPVTIMQSDATVTVTAYTSIIPSDIYYRTLEPTPLSSVTASMAANQTFNTNSGYQTDYSSDGYNQAAKTQMTRAQVTGLAAGLVATVFMGLSALITFLVIRYRRRNPRVSGKKLELPESTAELPGSSEILEAPIDRPVIQIVYEAPDTAKCITRTNTDFSEDPWLVPSLSQSI